MAFLNSFIIASKGMIEYTTYFITVLGVFILRSRLGAGMQENAPSHYSTSLLNPTIFCVVSVLIVVRGAVSHPLQSLLIFVFFGCGALIYRSLWWRRLVGNLEIQATGGR